MIEISVYIGDISDRPDTINSTDYRLTDISLIFYKYRRYFGIYLEICTDISDYFGQRLVKPTKIWENWLLMGFEPSHPAKNERGPTIHSINIVQILF